MGNKEEDEKNADLSHELLGVMNERLGPGILGHAMCCAGIVALAAKQCGIFEPIFMEEFCKLTSIALKSLREKMQGL